mmetsp:Transcript_43518/g.69608  ORF Transcript_43518/g.69608 Transcript_43518/m.69608 type:complete len:571 (+) Transcript_43518:275-1987(+)
MSMSMRKRLFQSLSARLHGRYGIGGMGGVGGWRRGELRVHTWTAAPKVQLAVELKKRIPEVKVGTHTELVCGNKLVALHNGEEVFPALFQAIESAKSEIMFEMYWFESDRAGWSIARRLMAASKRGVAVRVVYDAFGSFDADVEMFERMRKAGCEVLEFNPIPPWRHQFLLTRLNRRDHRKMLVVDRQLVIMGGMNICEHWYPRFLGGDDWRDVMVRIQGPVCEAYAQIFERMVGPLRDGHDDRGSLDETDLSGLTRQKSCTDLVYQQKVIFSTLSSFLLGTNHLRELREEVAASVTKGKDILTTKLFNRLRSLPENTLLLFPFQVVNNGQPMEQAGINAVSEAWWSAQGRLKVKMTNSVDLGSDTDQTKKRRLLFEQIRSKWQKLGSNVQIVTNDALSERNTIRRGYLRAISAAEKSITIVNSYFVPCRSMRRAIHKAAERGVKVKLVLPSEETDLRTVRLASHSIYGGMLRRGVEIYEYLPSVLHSKVCVIDSSVSTLGSYNFDFRSWHYNLEIVSIIHDHTFATDLETRIQEDIDNRCEKIELETWNQRPWFKRLTEKVLFGMRYQM